MEDNLKQNLLVLSNAVELGSAVVMQIAGNDIANTVNGKLITPDDLRDALASKIQGRLSKYLEAAA